MREILPGLLHWTTPHSKIKWEVSSYSLTEPKILIDPLIPASGPEPFAAGDKLPGDIETIGIGVISPDETALADGVVRMGDNPEAIKAGSKEALGSVCEREFDHLLLAHGDPWIGGARDALLEFGRP